MSYFSAALSGEQKPFFLVPRLSSKLFLSFVIVKSPPEESKVESGKLAKTRASQGTNPMGIGEKG